VKRSGVTLLEVLFAIGIVSVGILGVLATLVIAGKQAADGTRMNGADRLGRNAIREFEVRGFNRASGPRGTWAAVPVNGWSYCLDPLYVATNGSAMPASLFPAIDPATAPGPRMARVSVRRFPGDQSVAPLPPIGQPLAESIFTAKDDLAFSMPDDRTLPPVQHYGAGAGTRQSTGALSWFATVVPTGVDHQWFCASHGFIWDDDVIWASTPPAFICVHCWDNGLGTRVVVTRTGVEANTDHGFALLSIAVCHRRDTQDPNLERLVNVERIDEEDPSFPVTGDVSQRGHVWKLAARPGRPDSDMDAKEGQWVLIAGVLPNSRTLFQWHRILGADEVLPAGQPDIYGNVSAVDTRSISTAGRAWPLHPNQTQVCLFNSVVAVYEKTVKMEE